MISNLLLSMFTIGFLSFSLGQATSQSRADDKPIPIGPVSLEDIMHFNPEYRERADKYKLHTDALEFLQHVSQPVTIEVFYGGWCDDSQEHVPEFLRLIETAHNPNLFPTFFGVDRNKQEPSGLTQARHVDRVPSFLVLADGHEIGRIVEAPEKSVEEDLVKILKSAAEQTH